MHHDKNWGFVPANSISGPFIFVKLIGIGSLNLDSFNILFYPDPFKTINPFQC